MGVCVPLHVRMCACMCTQFAALSSVSFVDDRWPQCWTVGHSWHLEAEHETAVYPSDFGSSCTTMVRAVLLTEVDDTSRVSPISLSLHPHLFLAKEPRVRGVATSAFLPFNTHSLMLVGLQQGD